MIISVNQQREIEEKAQVRGVPLLTLMENAGRTAFRYIYEHYDIKDMTVAVMCGSGGNGGDGFTVARHLKQNGAKPSVILCGATPSSEPAATMYRRAVVEGVPIVDLIFEQEKIAKLISDSALIVDAVYGIGFHAPLSDELSELFERVNNSNAGVVSLDVPSGVDSDTGGGDENAVRADVTIGFIGTKTAHVLKSSRKWCGRVVLVDIGIPREAYSGIKYDTFENSVETVSRLLEPKPEICHKGDMGRLVIAAGSESYRGAAVLCTLGALRAGAGLVELASVEPVITTVLNRLPEATMLDLTENRAQYGVDVERADAVVIGPGLSKSHLASALVEATVKSAKKTVVIDADGLNLLSERIELITEGNAESYILTPHIGEFSRLSGETTENILADRVGIARNFALKNKCILVLKSENTVIAAPDGDVYVNTNGNSGLAKGGSGDLLSGMIGGFAAMGKNALDAARLGVYLHSAAADLCAEDINPYSMLTTDVAGYIAPAITNLLGKKE